MEEHILNALSSNFSLYLSTISMYQYMYQIDLSKRMIVVKNKC